MSATLDAELFGQYFNGCPTMHAEGRTFPVQQVRHHTHILYGVAHRGTFPTAATRRKQAGPCLKLPVVVL